MKNFHNWIPAIIAVLLLAIIIIFVKRYEMPDKDVSDGMIAIISAFIGVLVTISATSSLIEKQGNVDRHNELDLSRFKQKQDIFISFLKRLEEIMVSLTEQNIKGNDRRAYENIPTLESMIFEFSYLRIHMSEDDFNDVLSHATEIFDANNSKHIYRIYKEEIVEKKQKKSEILNQSLFQLMSDISKSLFAISKILNRNLYGISDYSDAISNKEQASINKMLETCGLKELSSQQQEQ